MKKTIVLSVCIIVIVGIYIWQNNKKSRKTEYQSELQNTYLRQGRVVVIEGCEYIEFPTSDNYYGITHRGNCKNH